LSWTPADGAAKPHSLIPSKDVIFPESLTANGKTLLFSEYNSERGYTRWIVTLENKGGRLQAGKPQALAQASFASGQLSVSPDGRWLAYDSNESGTRQVYVRAFPDQAARWQVSTAGGFTPQWSRTVFPRSGESDYGRGLQSGWKFLSSGKAQNLVRKAVPKYGIHPELRSRARRTNRGTDAG